MNITLKNGEIMQIDAPVSVYEIAGKISAGLQRVACAGKVNGEMVDLRHVVDKDCALEICTFEDEEGRHAFRHSASHVLAQAVKRLYPEVKLAIGPAIARRLLLRF